MGEVILGNIPHSLPEVSAGLSPDVHNGNVLNNTHFISFVPFPVVIPPPPIYPVYKTLKQSGLDREWGQENPVLLCLGE